MGERKNNTAESLRASGINKQESKTNWASI
jgi:hypothetical protein